MPFNFPCTNHPCFSPSSFQEQLPDLWSHFQDLNLEAHMYASQWFLTLFTAKFPLCMVFHITDLLLCEVINPPPMSNHKITATVS